ncbi:hypothetical protein CDV26_08635 [Francisella halioticida]|uniref:Aspartate racemase n=1 Tax=Francisella halioticida TaxID=549298 RepID=A0ABN5AY37_9GAMM|nr:hypothetical protein CDV26_08635 [Francisella halioticida]
MVQGLIRLQSWGAKLIAMPCNMAHRYFEQLQASINVPLLNIIDATLAKLPN